MDSTAIGYLDDWHRKLPINVNKKQANQIAIKNELLTAFVSFPCLQGLGRTGLNGLNLKIELHT